MLIMSIMLKNNKILLLLLCITYCFCLQLPQEYEQFRGSSSEQLYAYAGVKLANSSSSCQENCLVCTPGSLTSCTQCKPGFIISTNGSCVHCSSGCAICEGQYSCVQCLVGYTLVIDNYLRKCIGCGLGCSQCQVLQLPDGQYLQTLTSCSTCQSGFYPTKLGSSFITSCSPCIAGCVTCQSNSTCYRCAVGFGYNQQSNVCYACQYNCVACSVNEGCQECKIGYYLTVTSGQPNSCTSCIKNCMQCLDYQYCTRCIDGFYPYNSINPQSNATQSLCISCPNKCEVCYNQKICLSCLQGFYLNITSQMSYNNITNETIPIIKQAVCIACSDNCLQCQNSICQACQTGYYLGQSGQCVTCGVACHSCNNLGQCLECIGSFYLTQGRCQPCESTCSYCVATVVDNQQVSYCINCNSVQYASQNGVCVLCKQLTQSCQTCSSPTQCLTCVEGYYLNQNGACLPYKSLGAAYIVMICIACLIAIIAIGFGIWACWRYKNGYGLMDTNNNNEGIRASYYQIP